MDIMKILRALLGLIFLGGFILIVGCEGDDEEDKSITITGPSDDVVIIVGNDNDSNADDD